MNKQREALKLALDALDCIYSPLHVREINKVGAAMRAIREALAEPEKTNQCGETCERAKLCAVCANGLAEQEQEPVAWTTMPCDGDWVFLSGKQNPNGKLDGKWHPLYLSPQNRKPLTDEQIDALELPPNGCTMRELVRAIERAHGIGEE